MNFKVGDKVTVKSLEEILNSGAYYSSPLENYINFSYTHIPYNKEYMLPFCKKTFFVVSIIDALEPSYRLGTTNRVVECDCGDVKQIQNFVWHEKWLSPKQKFVLDFDGTLDEREI